MFSPSGWCRWFRIASERFSYPEPRLSLGRWNFSPSCTLCPLRLDYVASHLGINNDMTICHTYIHRRIGRMRSHLAGDTARVAELGWWVWSPAVIRVAAGLLRVSAFPFLITPSCCSQIRFDSLWISCSGTCCLLPDTMITMAIHTSLQELMLRFFF